MNKYYSLSQKRDYIDKDFMQSKLYRMDNVPEGPDAQAEYFKCAISFANDFLNKYKNKGWSSEYALQIVNDWMENLERIAKEMKHEADRRATQDT